MSFAANVKQEIAASVPQSACCRHAMAYGLLLFAREFNASGISIMTEHACVAEEYAKAIRSCGAEAEMRTSKAGKYTVRAEQSEIVKVLSAFSVSGKETFYRINRANLPNESTDDDGMNCCCHAFFKGAFLACGTISDPNKSYHLEFVIPYRSLCLDLLKMLDECGIHAKHMMRRGVNVIYIKDSESIEDLLNYMGATLSAFEIMNIKIYKNFRNVSNRRTNFDEANTSRVARAACEQINAIRELEQTGALQLLDDELRQIAALRMENPDASLSELGGLFSPPLSRSAVNHRLQKLLSQAAAAQTMHGGTNDGT